MYQPCAVRRTLECRNQVVVKKLAETRSRQDEEDAHEDWLNEQLHLRELAEAELRRRITQEKTKAEQEARKAAVDADAAAKKAAKEAAKAGGGKK